MTAGLTKRQYANWISTKSIPMMEVISKMHIYEDSIYENKWREELYSILHSTPLLRHGKLPKAKLIYRNLWEIHEDTLIRVLEGTIKDIKFQDDHDLELSYSPCMYRSALLYCKEYFKWISDHLSEYEYLTRYQVFDYLNTLGL